jgi:hypothetical protein
MDAESKVASVLNQLMDWAPASDLNRKQAEAQIDWVDKVHILRQCCRLRQNMP